jgi:protein-tyrosine phosphatase
MSDRPYRILMVCTGNICRSPVMERLLAARLMSRLGPAGAARFEISSAGTWGMVGEPMSPEAAETLIELDGDPTDFAAREIGVKMIQDADLILTATRDHRRLVVTSDPKAAGPTLTLREFARLLGPVTQDDIAQRVASDDPGERMAAIVAAALGQRGLVPIADPGDDDIADPYRRSRAMYERSASDIDAALDVLLALLAPTGG